MDCLYSIHNELAPEHVEQLHQLAKKMWWSADVTKDDIDTMLKHSIPFAVLDNNTNKLVGFARVLSDELYFAYIYDVMLEESLRGKGIGKMIMQSILSNPQLARVKHFELTCLPEMAGYYQKFGFSKDYGKVVAMRLTQDEQ